MPINYWRRVESDHDGHVTNECLLCYGRFTGSAHGWKYCPLCGTRWLGEKAETEEQAAFRWAVGAAEHRQWAARNYRNDPHPVWLLEKREWSQWQGGPVEWSEWKIFHRLHGKTAAEALEDLRHWRRVEEGEREGAGEFRYGAEWRLRLVRE